MDQQEMHFLAATHNQRNAKLTSKTSAILQSLMLTVIASAGETVNAAPMVHAVMLNGEQANGGQNIAMSRSGRYILNHIPTTAEFTTAKIFDLKTQALTPNSNTAALPTLTNMGYEFISPNGRYISYPTPIITSPFSSQGIAIDMVTQESFDVPTTDEERAISDNGFVAARNQHQIADVIWEDGVPESIWGGLIHLNFKDKTQRKIPNLRGQHSRVDRLDWFSADGQIILFNSSDPINNTLGFKIFNDALSDENKIVPFNPIENNIPLLIEAQYGETTIALSSNGKFIAFKTDSYAHSNSNNFLYRATLTPTGHSLRSFDLSALAVTIEDGISISSTGRFISFRGQLKPGHAEYAAAQALGHTSFYRIFRYDSEQNQLVTVSVAKDGGPIRNRFISSGVANVYQSTVISDDGSIIGFSSDADNLTNSITYNTLDKKYYAYLSNGFSRNYQFVDMPNSDTRFLPFAPMTLVGNNLWEGTITFDGVGPESFRFDVGGNLAESTPSGTPDNAITFGPGATAGQAVSGTGTIPVTGGAGTYKVTFNDQTLKYTVANNGDWKRTVVFMYGETKTGQDMFIRGGLDHAKAKAVMGQDCDVNPALCSIPIRHLNTLNPTTAPWKLGDSKLDWQGIEAGQGSGAQGSPLDWTTNFWPSSWGAKKTRDLNGYGEALINQWGQHYWMLEVEMDCSKTHNGWFELKSFISNGPGWEGNIAQAGGPWASNNHFAECGKMNVFKRGQSTPIVVGGTL